MPFICNYLLKLQSSPYAFWLFLSKADNDSLLAKMKSHLLKCFPYFFSSQAFVENNPAIKWCPIPGCERAVRLTRPGSNSTGSDTLSFPMLKAPAVDCGKGHLFCWSVLNHLHLQKLRALPVPGKHQSVSCILVLQNPSVPKS